MKFRFTFFLLLLAGTIDALAQTGEIRGFIYEKENSEPSIYTNVYLKGTTYGAQTNLDGFFSISRIKPGDYTLLVTSVGFDTISIPIQVKSGDLISKKFYLERSTIQMKEIEVSAETDSKKRSKKECLGSNETRKTSPVKSIKEAKRKIKSA